ncbi:MAG: fasciclin domain-containing protein [Bacteroidales bacterium]
MNPIKSQSHIRFSRIALVLAVFACLPLTHCKEDPQLWLKKSTEQVAGDYMASHSDYTEFTKLAEYAGLTSLLKVRGPFTIFLPTDEAMFAYYEKIGVGSLEEMSADDRTMLAKTHVIPLVFPTSEIGWSHQGAQPAG